MPATYIHNLRRYWDWIANALGRHKRAVAVVGGLTLATVFTTLYACQPSPRFKPPTAVFLDTVITEPVIRVRIHKGLDTLFVTGPNLVRVGPDVPDDVKTPRRDLHTPITIVMHKDGFLIRSAEAPAMTWALPVLALAPLTDAPIEIDGNPFPGTLVLHPRSGSGTPPGRIDVVNHTPLEDYLPGVVHREIYSDWHPTAFMVQAIAARTYAIEQIAQHRKRHFDLEATQASQAYGGSRATARALDAVRLSRGVVLTYNARILPTYYSSCCGGVGQDAALTFPYGLRVTPLKGTVHDYCRDVSPHYNWGPLIRDRATLAKRIAAWARASKHPAASITAIKDLRITAHNTAGRPARFTITDASDKTFHLNPEQFRFACNYRAADLAPLVKTARLKSSYVRMHLQPTTVAFTGRGFGHGVGLCQWGAQVMAQRNYDVATILDTYYPEATLRRAY